MLLAARLEASVWQRGAGQRLPGAASSGKSGTCRPNSKVPRTRTLKVGIMIPLLVAKPAMGFLFVELAGEGFPLMARPE